jgi:polyhydroxyalkanoate synthase subunit PhaC
LVQETLNPSAKAAADGPDPWDTLVDQLWQANPLSKLMPIDAAEVTRAFRQIWLDALSHPARAWSNYVEFSQQYARLMTETTLRLWGLQPGEPVVAPDKADKRFSAPDWQRNAVLDAIKQTYLLTATSMLKSAADIEGLDSRQQRRLVFYLRQFLDAISPTNFAFTNPQVIHTAIESGGESLTRGFQNLVRDLQVGQLRMTDTDAFAPGRNLALTPGHVVYRNKLIELIQYTPTTRRVQAVPLLFIPPWINKFYILDMQPENSLIRYVVEQGFSTFVISWKNPDTSMEATTFDDYLELGPITALEVVREITGAEQVHPIGYCIGGTLLSMLLPYLASSRDSSIGSASFFVALQDFSEVGDTAVFIDEPQVAYIEQQMLERGYLDSRQMASMFNMLRANDLIWSNVVNNYLLGKEPPAFDLLYWNADGTRMARAAHSFYLRNTYLENNLIKPGKVSIKGVPIDLGRIDQDVYAIGAEQDHIVPWQAAWQITRLASGPVRFVLAGSGHIAGVINPPSKGRGYRVAPEARYASPSDWMDKAERHDGSWWTDWVDWLRPRSGKQVPAPSVGNAEHPPLAPAPGQYVLEK